MIGAFIVGVITMGLALTARILYWCREAARQAQHIENEVEAFRNELEDM